MRTVLAAVALLVAPSAGVVTPAGAQTQSPAAVQDVEFKSMTIVVGFTPGGGYDTYARLLARHIGRNTPGQPSVVVQNMPGSSSLKAVQYLDANAPRDGSVMTAFNPGLITESLLDPEKIKFKFTQVAWVGSITRDLRACYAWAATGIKSWDDFVKAPEFNIGAPATGTSTYINAAVLKNMFGIKLRQVTGYPGSAEERLAIERGELDGGCGAWSSNPPDWLNTHRINPLVAFSPGEIPNMVGKPPFIVDLAKDEQDKNVLNVLIAPDAVGRPYVASRQVPVARLAALRASFDATMRDPQFLAEGEKLELPVVGPMPGIEAEAIIANIYKSPPALVERAKVVAR